MRKDINVGKLMLEGEKMNKLELLRQYGYKISFCDKGLERSLIKCCNCNIFLLYLEI